VWPNKLNILKKVSKLECRFQRGDIFLIDVTPEMENSGEGGNLFETENMGKITYNNVSPRRGKTVANEEDAKRLVHCQSFLQSNDRVETKTVVFQFREKRKFSFPRKFSRKWVHF
jgi:hypothetical protein